MAVTINKKLKDFLRTQYKRYDICKVIQNEQEIAKIYFEETEVSMRKRFYKTTRDFSEHNIIYQPIAGESEFMTLGLYRTLTRDKSITLELLIEEFTIDDIKEMIIQRSGLTEKMNLKKHTFMLTDEEKFYVEQFIERMRKRLG